MQAGFAKETVNPPIGTPMQGLWQQGPCTRIREDLYVRALALEHAGEEALILGLDLLFFDRPVVARIKAALGRRLGLGPERILLNFSHNHAGPATGSWGYQQTPDPAYLQTVEAALLRAAVAASTRRQPVTLHGAMTACALPVSRRKLNADNQAEWAPDLAAPVCRAAPVCLLRGADGNVVSLLFSASCHPSSWYEPEICGDYPGVAARLLNARFATEGALFLQGCAGDTKPVTVAKEGRWQSGTWDDVETAGRLLADAVADRVAAGLDAVAPAIRAELREIDFALQPPPGAAELAALRDNPETPPQRRAWAVEMLGRLQSDGRLADTVPIQLHALRIGHGLRLIGLECEPVAEIATHLLQAFPDGVTFPLGYTNGTQLYLPVDAMLAQHGYEVDSYWEYHVPAPLAAGIDRTLDDALARLNL